MLAPLLFLALATQQFATATDPATLQQTSVDCRIAALAYDVDLGHASNHSGDTIDRVCITAQDDVYHLASDGRTLKALTGHGWNGNVHLSLQAVAPNLWSVLSCRAASTAVRTWEGRRKLLTASGRYFEGQRRVRLLSVLVEVQGAVAEYAGSSREEREAWAMEQRTFMSSVYEWSTYSKLGFDESASIVRTVVLPATQELTNSDCSNRGFEIARLAAAQLEAEGFDWQRVDGVLYYEPETATPSCGRNGWGTLGVCYVGLLDAPTFQPAPAYRQSHFWRAGCFVRYQRAGVAARANIGAHEFGHHLGLGHAGGNGETRLASGSLSTYGDSSAVMGNDHSAINSFTAPARFYLGALPEAAVHTSIDEAVTLRALSLGPSVSSAALALALECPGCVSRTDPSVTGGELWFSFRGDAETCNEEHPAGSTTFRCHSDHSVKYNQVHVHYKLPGDGPTTEKWYWLSHEDDPFELSSGGFTVKVCTIGDESATVAVAKTAAEAIGKCSGSYPPPSPPSPPAPPSPPPPPAGCADTCNYAEDFECDDGGPGAEYIACDFGTDCQDCGPRAVAPPSASPPLPSPSPSPWRPPPVLSPSSPSPTLLSSPPSSPWPPPALSPPPLHSPPRAPSPVSPTRPPTLSPRSLLPPSHSPMLPAPPSPPPSPSPLFGVVCHFTLAGTVEGFDGESFGHRLLQLNLRATGLVNLGVASASVAVRGTLVYASAEDAAADATRMQEMSTTELGVALGESIEAHSAQQISLEPEVDGRAPMPPKSFPATPTAPVPPPDPGSKNPSYQKLIILCAMLVLGSILIAASATLIHRVCTTATSRSTVDPKPSVRRQSTISRLSKVSPPNMRHASFEVVPAQPLGFEPSVDKNSWVTVPLSPRMGKPAAPTPNVKALERATAWRNSLRTSKADTTGAEYV